MNTEVSWTSTSFDFIVDEEHNVGSITEYATYVEVEPNDPRLKSKIVTTIDEATKYLTECNEVTKQHPYEYCDACGELLDLDGNCYTLYL